MKKGNPFEKKNEPVESEESVEEKAESAQYDKEIKLKKRLRALETRVEILEDRLTSSDQVIEPLKEEEKEVVSHEEFDGMDTSAMFAALINRITDERAKSIISKAEKEYAQLVKRTNEDLARQLVGKLLTDSVTDKLVAANAVEEGAI